MVGGEKQQCLLKGLGQMIKKCHCSRSDSIPPLETTLYSSKSSVYTLKPTHYSLWLLIIRILKRCVIGSSLIFSSIGYFHLGSSCLQHSETRSTHHPRTLSMILTCKNHPSFCALLVLFCLRIWFISLLSSDWNSSPKHTWVSLVQPWV